MTLEHHLSRALLRLEASLLEALLAEPSWMTQLKEEASIHFWHEDLTYDLHRHSLGMVRSDC